jgi:hypothetical protein
VEGEIVRDYISRAAENFPSLKVLMQCSLVLLVKVSERERERESIALESEESKMLGNEEGKVLDDTCKERILHIFIDESS